MISRKPLDGLKFEVLVIGGGINGVAIARECARGGRSTLLVEQDDFASGTTSRSTRLIHGGLRYLEYLDLAQVRESLLERQRLLRQRPHLVRPIQFFLALGAESRRSALAIRAGLWFYRRMGRLKVPEGAARIDDIERLLDAGPRFSIFSFEDAQCEFPERLVAEWLVEAIAFGCETRNHTKVLRVTTNSGRVTGALLRDQLAGREERVECTCVINATGPWADKICESSGIHARQAMIGGVRGSHVVLPQFAGSTEAAVYSEGVDGRPIFVVPWNGQVLAGSTEVRDNADPSMVRPSNDEIEYLLSSLRGLFPQSQISLGDVRYSFAGIRPLPYSPNASPAAITRRHELHDHSDDGAAGMISIIGGKLTTAACVARECAKKIGVKTTGAAPFQFATEENIGKTLERVALGLKETANIPVDSARALVEWHGSRSLEIARTAAGDAEIRAPLCSHSHHIVAEAVNAFEHECAVTLGDVLLRRVPVALGACWSQECTREAASRIGIAMGWDVNQIAKEIAAFETEFDAFLCKPR